MPKPWLLTLIALASGPAAALELNLVVFPNPGLFDVAADGAISGRGSVLLARLGAASGLTLNLQAMPIPRALATGASAPGQCLVGLARTPEREPHYLWAGPVASGALVAYARADEARPLRDGADLRSHSVVVQRDSAPAQWLRQQGITPQEANSPASALRMLQAGRADFWVANELSAAPILETEGGGAVKPHWVISRMDVYVACHPATAPELTGRLQQALQRLRRQGELAEFGLR